MKDQSKVIAALLIGAAAGAVLGLLFAPDSGEGTRGTITDYANDLAGKARVKANELKDYGNNAVNTVKSKLSSAADDLYNYRENAEQTVRNEVDNAKSKVKATADNLNDSIQQA